MTVTQGDLFAAIETRNAILGLIAGDPQVSPTARVLADAISENFAPGDLVSANNVRPYLPPWVKTHALGPVFACLANRGALTRVGDEPSTKPNTHGKPVNQYRVVGS